MGRGFIAVIVSLITVSLGLHGPVSTTRAQESTPPATGAEVEIATGVTFALLPASDNPPTLYRLRLAPDTSLPFAGDPAISLIYVESGALALEMDAPVNDARLATPSAGDDDGTALAVGPGDYFVLPPLVAGEMRNDGQTPASIVIAAITPGLLPATAASTPAPE